MLWRPGFPLNSAAKWAEIVGPARHQSPVAPASGTIRQLRASSNGWPQL
jgi:hypothetical protein